MPLPKMSLIMRNGRYLCPLRLLFSRDSRNCSGLRGEMDQVSNLRDRPARRNRRSPACHLVGDARMFSVHTYARRQQLQAQQAYIQWYTSPSVPGSQKPGGGALG